MADPVSISNSTGQKVDTIYYPDGTAALKVAVGGPYGLGSITPDGAAQMVGTHAATGASIGATDPVVALGGVYDSALDGPTGDPVVPILVDSFGRPLVVVRPTVGALTNRSGSISAGGTSQQLMAASTTRKYMFIQNLDASEAMWINFTTAAVQDQPSIRLGPYDTFSMEGSFVSTEEVKVIATTTGHKYAAKEA